MLKRSGLRIAIASCLLCCVPLGAAQEASESSDLTTRPISIRVVDAETAAPIAGAELLVRYDSKRERITTDAAGKVIVQAPEPQPEYFTVTVAKADGYLGMRSRWEFSERKRDTLPDEHTFSLVRGRSIGGRVVDSDGQPVSNARVNLLISGNSDDSTHFYIDTNRPIARTDDNGNWSFNAAPSELTEFWMRVDHADFATDQVWDLKPTPDELYAGTSVITLQMGMSISGRVLDAEGKPIHRATVFDGLWQTSGGRSAHTDEEGKFTLKNLDETRAVMTVQAEGYAPTMVVKTLRENLAPVEIVLEPGRVLKLKVVDVDGTPVPEASVRIGAWRGGESLRMLPLRSPKTDAEGMLVWNSAPTDSVAYSVETEGLFPSEPLNIIADDEVHTVVLRKPFIVSGTVVDAESGEPLSDYKIFPVLHWTNGGVHISRYEDKPVEPGSFRYELRRLDCDHGVRIEAPGYRPTTTEAFDLSGNEKTFSIRLEKAEDIAGRIVDLEGVPVTNAAITVCNAMDQVNINNGVMDEMFKGYSVTSDADGQFAIAPQDGEFKVLAVTATGYAEASAADLERTRELVLQPWATVRGTLTRDGKPMAGKAIHISTIRLHMNNRPLVFERGYTQTGSDGGFTFERVAPGSAIVCTDVSPWQQSELTSGERLPIYVRPGETYDLALGAGGVSVTGQLALPEGDTREMAWNWGLNYIYRKEPGVPAPEEVRRLGFTHENGWNEAWLSTPEGRAFFDTLEGHFVKLTPDGAFRIDGVRPGEYQLAFRLYDEPDGTCMVTPISTSTFDVNVAEPNAAGTLLDLGKLVVEVYPELKAGDAASEFNVPSLDGATISLQSLRGKYVLLDFWATWCGPCRDELPNFKKIWEKNAGRNDFTIVSLSLDQELSSVKKFVADEQLPWMQGHVGDWSTSTLTKHYNVSAIPATFLIGPDGVLIARDLRGPSMIKAVEDALAK